MKGADFVWDEAKLDRFIANPEQTVPGNNMKPFSGLASADDRAKVIAFLLSSTTADEAKSRNAAISRWPMGVVTLRNRVRNAPRSLGTVNPACPKRRVYRFHNVLRRYAKGVDKFVRLARLGHVSDSEQSRS